MMKTHPELMEDLLTWRAFCSPSSRPHNLYFTTPAHPAAMTALCVPSTPEARLSTASLPFAANTNIISDALIAPFSPSYSYS